MASREQDKASANLLRRSLRDSGDACPEPEILAAYFERSLDADETARYELHFSQCARCREQLAAMHRASEPAPAGAAQPRQSSHWAWLWDWRLLAPALAVLVIAAVWIARRPATKQVAEKSPQPPLVAMSRPSEPPAAPMPAPVLDQYSNTVTRLPNKTLTAPDAGVAGAIKQSPALTESRPVGNKEELASNQPRPESNPAALDELKKDDKSFDRDSAGAANGVAAGVAASRVVVPATPAAASPPPPAKATSETVQAGAGTVGGLISEKELVATESPATKAKPSGAPASVRTLTQQAQTQNVLQSQALAIEAVDKRSTGNIITTPDPKVMWRIAEAGFVERTTDSGASWQGQLPDANAQLTAGSAPSTKVCWFVGSNGVILLTKDANHWHKIPPPVSADFVAVTAQDASTAAIMTADGRKFTTTDGGKHWNPAP